MKDRGYLADASGVELLPGAIDALETLRSRGMLLVLVSNQSGVARGLISREEHERVHARFCEMMAAAGVTLDACYYCEHGPDDGCPCRKPRPGMLRAAAAVHGIDLPSSIMVGDKPSDVDAGRAAGCATALLGATGHADVVAPDWFALSRALTELMGRAC